MKSHLDKNIEFVATIDFETRSECDIAERGGWLYSRHLSTHILCMAYDIHHVPTGQTFTSIWLPPRTLLLYMFNMKASYKGLRGHFYPVKGKGKSMTKKRAAELEKNPNPKVFTWPTEYGKLINRKGMKVGFRFDGPLETYNNKYVRLKIQSRPEKLCKLIEDSGSNMIVEAHNVFFEKCVWWNICQPQHGFPEVPEDAWRCSAALAASYSLPRSLDGVGIALDLPVKKNLDGKLVMQQMVKPQHTGAYYQDTERYTKLFDYCLDDVRAEKEISARLGQLDERETSIWQLDQTINTRGIPLDKHTLQAGIGIIEEYTKVLEKEMSDLTGGRIENIRQTQVLKLWLEEQGVLTDSVDKGAVIKILERKNISDVVRRVLTIRQDLGQTSTAKYKKMLAMSDEQGVSRDQLMYYGANTGRFSGRGWQIHNMPRGSLEQDDAMIRAIGTGDWEALVKYGSVMDVLSSCVRGMILAPKGKKLIVSDYSNIEGRALAWLAGEDWKVQAFRDFDNGDGHDIYKLTYAQSFDMDVEDVTKDQRQLGKVQELALGYMGGVGAFQDMAKAYGVEVSDKVADELKTKWRDKHPKIKKFWYELEDAAISAILEKGTSFAAGDHISFLYDGDFLYAILPAGGTIKYYQPKLRDVETPWGQGKKQITYHASKGGSSSYREDTYGGKLAENCIAEDTEVLTDKGWVKIQNVTVNHLLWDGEQWVNHDGLTRPRLCDTIEVNSVYMTPEHEVLDAEERWRFAKTIKSDWKKVSLPEGY